jgi:hypothetical protein
MVVFFDTVKWALGVCPTTGGPVRRQATKFFDYRALTITSSYSFVILNDSERLYAKNMERYLSSLYASLSDPVCPACRLPAGRQGRQGFRRVPMLTQYYLPRRCFSTFEKNAIC